ncbi:hypothetical protein PFISCL1PPCAC_9687, partial [Pristionchus fissidentatus]
APSLATASTEEGGVEKLKKLSQTPAARFFRHQRQEKKKLKEMEREKKKESEDVEMRGSAEKTMTVDASSRGGATIKDAGEARFDGRGSGK